jgi:hypothetical protein
MSEGVNARWQVFEGGSREMTVRLATKPQLMADGLSGHDVTIQLLPDMQLEVNLPRLTFTVNNWDRPQVVLVSGKDDTIVEAAEHIGILAFRVTSCITLLFHHNEWEINLLEI